MKIARDIWATEYRFYCRWCARQGWTEPFCQGEKWYAFPPGAVIPQKIPRHYLGFVYGCLRLIVPSDPRELSSEKLQNFINHYLKEKIWLEEEEKEKAYIASKIAQFTSLEKLELSGYLEAKIKNIKKQMWIYLLKSIAYLTIFMMLVFGVIHLFPITSLLHSVCFFSLGLLVLIWSFREYFRVALANINECSPYESLLFYFNIRY